MWKKKKKESLLQSNLVGSLNTISFIPNHGKQIKQAQLLSHFSKKARQFNEQLAQELVVSGKARTRPILAGATICSSPLSYTASSSTQNDLDL